MPIARRVKRALWSGIGRLGKTLGLGGIPILTYHSIDDSGSLISVSPAAFAAQMEYLHRHGFRALSLRDYVVASWLGMMPGTLLYVYLGSIAGDLARAGGRASRTPAEWAFYAVGLVATIVVTVFVTRVARRALAERVPLT